MSSEMCIDTLLKIVSGIYPADSLTAQGGLLQLLITDVWVRRGTDWLVLARHTSLPRS